MVKKTAAKKPAAKKPSKPNVIKHTSSSMQARSAREAGYKRVGNRGGRK